MDTIRAADDGSNELDDREDEKDEDEEGEDMEEEEEEEEEEEYSEKFHEEEKGSMQDSEINREGSGQDDASPKIADSHADVNQAPDSTNTAKSTNLRSGSDSPDGLSQKVEALDLSDIRNKVTCDLKTRSNQQRKYNSKRNTRQVERPQGSKAKQDKTIKLDRGGFWDWILNIWILSVNVTCLAQVSIVLTSQFGGHNPHAHSCFYGFILWSPP